MYKKLDGCLQLFDHCLAPNTLGDGTGCDNMTAVIVQFRPELANQNDRKSAKRSASPGVDTSTDTTKRPKTEETPCVWLGNLFLSASMMWVKITSVHRYKVICLLIIKSGQRPSEGECRKYQCLHLVIYVPTAKESPKHILIVCRLKNISFLQIADHCSCSR